GFQYGETNRNQGPSIGAKYRFVRGEAELAADLTGHVFTLPGYSSGGSVIPAVLFRLHASPSFRIDLDPAVTFQLATQSGTGASANAVRLDVPLALLGNVTEALDLGLNTGLTIYDVSETRSSTGIPLGFFLGYVLRGAHGPAADIDPFFNFPYFVMPGRVSPTNTEQYQVGVTVTGYLYL
ncbi:MAG TPA: hypothetical protein VHU80_03830, partial [Polyangiaceae bacterium]|nr:hypothetical protein [Polyangiaceae bacterium]